MARNPRPPGTRQPSRRVLVITAPAKIRRSKRAMDLFVAAYREHVREEAAAAIDHRPHVYICSVQMDRFMRERGKR